MGNYDDALQRQRPWPSVEDRHPDPWQCPYCESIEGEDHQTHCPRFLPTCSVCQGPTAHYGKPCAKCSPPVYRMPNLDRSKYCEHGNSIGNCSFCEQRHAKKAS